MLYKVVLVSALQQCESATGIHISLDISNFLEEISSLSHSVVFLYFTQVYFINFNNIFYYLKYKQYILPAYPEHYYFNM